LSAQRPDIRPAIAEDDPLPPEDRVTRPAQFGLDDLYREHAPRLLRFFSRRTSAELASDLVQQIFSRVAGFPAEYRERIANPGHYFRRSAVNLLADEAKLAARRSKHLHVPADDVDLRAPDQIAALEARDMLHRLEHAMQRLKPRTREIFLAHRIDGYSYVEIATITGLSVKSVEKHMSKAIAFVDRILSDR
jgi:RNA polymerase sigma-70 factor (ECF subfamily)